MQVVWKGGGWLGPTTPDQDRGNTRAAPCTLPVGAGHPGMAGAAAPEGNCMRPSWVTDLRSDAPMKREARDMPRGVGSGGQGARGLCWVPCHTVSGLSQTLSVAVSCSWARGKMQLLSQLSVAGAGESPAHSAWTTSRGEESRRYRPAAAGSCIHSAPGKGQLMDL